LSAVLGVEFLFSNNCHLVLKEIEDIGDKR
jgi:hypothetical protein